jgi:hypothetical protein
MDTYDVEARLASGMNVICIGGRESGKTTLLKYLLYCMRHKLDAVNVCAFGNYINAAYAPHVPQDCIHVVDTHAKLATHFATHEKLHRHARRSAIVFEDCLSCYKPPPGLLDTLLRSNTQVLASVQYPLAIHKGDREQFDVVIVFPRDVPTYCEAVCNYGLDAVFPSGAVLQEVFRTLRRHEALVFDARLHRAGQLCLFKLEAPSVLPPFFVGPPDAKPATARRCSVADAVLPVMLATALGVFMWLLA